ncbi:OadG family protein [Cloacibacillus sp.]|uniref:OadG family protein n=1 Tax=Cloacibacillus sp. TaxID=2049023 RepID=UPI0025C27A1E|nr:OadG family protein [Cloacibacillus sp.]MCC8056723.1 OadG family protein [Cloacibacillus sp.]
MTGSSISSYFVGVSGRLTMSLIAFSIVFIVIVGLMLVMMGMKHVCSAIDNMGKPKPAATAQPSPAPAAPAAPAPAAPAAAVSADDDELLAVISAAIMAACGSTARVVAFSPVKAPAPTAWKNVGRLQNTEGC